MTDPSTSTASVSLTAPGWCEESAATDRQVWKRKLAACLISLGPVTTASAVTAPSVFASGTVVPSSNLDRYHEDEISPVDIPASVSEEARQLLRHANGEPFDDGVESPFSKALVAFVRLHGDSAIEALHSRMITGMVDADVASEALRWLGRMNDPRTRLRRWWVLVHCLRFSSFKIRDGALLGLDAMNDPASAKYLRLALAREAHPRLRRDMEGLLGEWNRGNVSWRSS